MSVADMQEKHVWNIEYKYIEEWLNEQDKETVACVFAALELLEDKGPSLGRPIVDTLHGTRVKNLKELRPASPKSSEIRVIFAFDPERSAVMLLAGDKSKGKNAKTRWNEWYARAIPEAERIYDSHVSKLKGGSNG